MKNVMKCMFVGFALMGCSAASESAPGSDVEQPVSCVADPASPDQFVSTFKVAGKTKQEMVKNTFIENVVDKNNTTVFDSTKIVFADDGTAKVACNNFFGKDGLAIKTQEATASAYWEYVE